MRRYSPQTIESTVDLRWPLSCVRFNDDGIFGPAVYSTYMATAMKETTRRRITVTSSLKEINTDQLG
jgi:hypothetical protein